MSKKKLAELQEIIRLEGKYMTDGQIEDGAKAIWLIGQSFLKVKVAECERQTDELIAKKEAYQYAIKAICNDLGIEPEFGSVSGWVLKIKTPKSGRTNTVTGTKVWRVL